MAKKSYQKVQGFIKPKFGESMELIEPYTERTIQTRQGTKKPVVQFEVISVTGKSCQVTLFNDQGWADKWRPYLKAGNLVYMECPMSIGEGKNKATGESITYYNFSVTGGKEIFKVFADASDLERLIDERINQKLLDQIGAKPVTDSQEEIDSDLENPQLEEETSGVIF